MQHQQQPYIDNGTIDVSRMSEAVLNTRRSDDKLAGIVGSTGTLAVGYNLSSRNSERMITTPLVNPTNTKAMWNKLGFFPCISETSKVKDEAAANCRKEADEILTRSQL